jgi:outer membrane protein assembly factor BamE (lipoprotein component of BamABCDE complex)
MNSIAKIQTSELSREPENAMSLRKQIPRAATIVAVTALLMVISACSDRKITKANVNEVTEGMAKKQVESILGQPTAIDTKDLLITKTTTYIYRQGKESVTIEFQDDKVRSKQSTLSE